MNIKIDSAKLSEVKILLAGVKGAAPRVISRSINKTLTSVNSQAAKEVSAIYNITQTNVKVNFSKLNASTARLSGQFQSKGGPKSLTSFSGTRQTLKGVSVKVLKVGIRKILKHAFIAKAKGSDQVFWREREFDPNRQLRPGFPYGRLPIKYRYPIKRLTGPRIEDALAKPAVLSRLENYAGDRMQTVLDQELNFELSKL